MSTKGHHLNELWWAGVPNATYQVSWKSVHQFWSRRFLKCFYHIKAWRPSWSCDQHHVPGFSSLDTWKLTYKILLKMVSGFLEKQVLIFICKCPGAKSKKWPWPSILTYLHKFIRCLLLPTFRSLATIVPEKSTVFTFSYRKTYLTKLTLP